MSHVRISGVLQDRVKKSLESDDPGPGGQGFQVLLNQAQSDIGPRGTPDTSGGVCDQEIGGLLRIDILFSDVVPGPW